MDAFDIFKKLRTGAKFDSKRFENDARKFQVGVNPRKEKSESDVVIGAKGGKRMSEDDVKDPKNLKMEENGIELDNAPKKKKNKGKKKSIEKLAQEQKKAVQKFRNENHIRIWGEDVPDPLETFSQLTTKYKVHPDVLNNIERLGFPDPTPIQMQAIPIMMQKREILGCAPTGSGKTAAFLIPIIHQLNGPKKLGFRAVIVEPTRELVRQVYLECCRLSERRHLRIRIIDKVHSAENKFGEKSSQKFDILITTPNRLVFLLNGNKPIISLKNVEWLVIDESDKLFETGKQGFRDQLAVIYKACTSPSVRHAMFSATFAYDVEQWCKLNLDNCVTVSIGNKNSAAETVDQELVFVGNESGKLVAFRDLVSKGLTPPVLVFVQSKERAQELFTELIYDGINVEVIHSDRTQLQRDNVVKSFRSGRIWVLICTELMGRGIDFKGVNLVVNFDFPPSVISYIHRIGRTGRAGRKGKAITFFTEMDFVNLRSIANVLRASNCPVPDFIFTMKSLKSSKSKRLANKFQVRESISTIPTYDEKQAKYKRERLLRKQQREDAKSVTVTDTQ